MISKIKRRTEKALSRLVLARAAAPWTSLPAPCRETLRRYLLRKGKRLRPVLFVLGYLGHAARPAGNMYAAAAALELLHAFILIHDDLIDRGARRRGGPSLHMLMNLRLESGPGARVRGEDLAMVMGDALYALAIREFLSIRAEPARKQRALEHLTRAALITAGGELEELMYTRIPLDRMKHAEICRIYDRKTAHYSFAMPLAMGAELAGAAPRTIAGLTRFGMRLGRAFQIKNDFGCGKICRGKNNAPVMADIREGKRTLLLLHAFKNAAPAEQLLLRRVYEQGTNNPEHLRRAAGIMLRPDMARRALLEMESLSLQADQLLGAIPMKQEIRDALQAYKDTLLPRPAGRL